MSYLTRNNLDDIDQRLVYADALVKAGDPRGKFVVTQYEKENAAKEKNWDKYHLLEKEEIEMWDEHGERFIVEDHGFKVPLNRHHYISGFSSFIQGDQKYQIKDDGTSYAIRSFYGIIKGEFGANCSDDFRILPVGECWAYRRSKEDDVHIKHNATLAGNAKIYGQVIVNDTAVVLHDSTVKTEVLSYITDEASIYGSTKIDCVKLYAASNARIYGNTEIKVPGIKIFGNCEVCDSILSGDSAWVTLKGTKIKNSVVLFVEVGRESERGREISNEELIDGVFIVDERGVPSRVDIEKGIMFSRVNNSIMKTIEKLVNGRKLDD